MLAIFEARNPRGSLLSLALDDDTSGLIVADIDGLDPVKATIVSSSFAKIDGEQYHSSRREARNIKLAFELEPDYIHTSVQDLRDRLYEYFMPKASVELRFYDSNGRIVNISGRVEDFVSPLFAREPRVNISIICSNPDFVDFHPTEYHHASTIGTDEFLVPYAGSVETGFWIILNVNQPMPGFTFYLRSPDDSLRTLDYGGSLVAGDVLTISTNSGNKGVTLTRNGTHYSGLNDISPQSSWHEFFPGDNYIRVHSDVAGVPYDIIYTNKYGGL